VLVPLNLLLSELKSTLGLAERKLKESEDAAAFLRESEDRYRDLVEHSEDLICIHDLEGNLLTVNDPPARILGYTKEELFHRPMRDFVVPEARALCDAYLLQIQRDGFAKGVLPVLTKNGEVRLWEYNNTLRKEGLNSPIVRGIAHDITEQKRAESALRMSEEKFCKAFQASPIEIAITTLAQGRFIDVNESFERQTGFTRDEVIGRTSLEINLWVNSTERMKVVEEIKSGRPVRNREVEIRTKSGEIGIKLYSTQPIIVAGEKCLLTVCEDITSRKNAEEALRLSEEKFRLMADNIKEIFWLLNPKTLETMYVSPAFERICEKSLESIYENPISYREIIHPGDAERVLAKLELLEQTGEFSEQFRIVCPGNSVKWVEVNGFTAKDSTGKVSALVGTAQEITARKQSERALHSSEAEYRSLFVEAPYGICRVAPDGTFIIFNDALVEILGYASADELRSKNLEKDVYQDPEERLRIFKQLETEDHLRDFDVQWKRKDGKVILVRANIRAVRGEGREITYLETMIEDITEKRTIERHLQQLQRMEAIGLLAGGIAHDFNNILTGILGNTELVLKSLGPLEPSRNRLRIIVDTALRGRDLTGKLLAFSHGESLPFYPINLNEEIQQMEDFIRAMIDESIDIELKLHRGSEKVLLGTSALYQILLNLALNAKDAMPMGGKLGIRTALAIITSDKPHPTGVPQGRYLCLEVSDTGYGMDKALLDRIFDPFFTTKKTGKGTGLGLYTVFGIVRQCAGHIRVSSEIGKGSTFEIYFPVVELPAQKEFEMSISASGVEAREVILLVEDNATVRNAVRDQLADLGYLVLCESNAVQALQDAESSYADIDLLLSDIVMPDLSGPDLARLLKEKQPRLKVLYMTGYAKVDVLPLNVLDAGTDLLRKPFTQEELNEKIRHLLCFK